MTTMPIREPKASKLSPVGDSSEEEAKKTKGVLYVGIDLGTSRTSCAASNGQRETVYSYVGYPKDIVARKALGKDILFGKEAIDKRVSLDLYRPFEEGMIKFSTEESANAPKDKVEKHMK